MLTTTNSNQTSRSNITACEGRPKRDQRIPHEISIRSIGVNQEKNQKKSATTMHGRPVAGVVVVVVKWYGDVTRARNTYSVLFTRILEFRNIRAHEATAMMLIMTWSWRC